MHYNVIIDEIVLKQLKKLDKNILKYHFVLTKRISKNFSSFYSDKIFSIISMKN